MSSALDHSTISAMQKYSFNSGSATLSRKGNLEILSKIFFENGIRTYSLLNWPKLYIPHWWAVCWMSLGIIPFSKIFLTVLFDTLTNNVSFLFLILHLLCIFLLIYMSDINSIMYVFSYDTRSTCPAHWSSKTCFEIVKSPYWFDIRHWKNLLARRKCCHSAKRLILYHFVLCTWCCFYKPF